MKWYRCVECKTVVSNKDITNGEGCRKCHGMKVRVTELSFWEKKIELLRWPSMVFNIGNWKTEK